MGGKNALTGALIGLSRATYGDTEPDERTWRLLAEGLAALGGEAEEKALEALTGRVREEKKRLVPRCSVCASPCGRNADYDMSLLTSAPAEVRELKAAILTAAQELAAKPGSGGEEAGPLLAKALFAIGEEWDADLLRPILEEAAQRRNKPVHATY
jgi:hydroxylamine reductase